MYVVQGSLKMASYFTYAFVPFIISLCLTLPISVLLVVRRKKTPEGTVYRLSHVHRILLKAVYVGLELKKKKVSEDCAQRTDSQAQATGSPTEPEAQATGNDTEPEAQATGSPTEPEAQATGSHTEPEANAADSESQTSTETAIDFEENDSEEEADPDFELYLYGKKLRRISVLSMVMLAAGVLGTTNITLWTTLLTRKSITCGEVGFDCFANDEPVTDCSMFENGTIVHINGTRYELACFRCV